MLTPPAESTSSSTIQNLEFNNFAVHPAVQTPAAPLGPFTTPSHNYFDWQPGDPTIQGFAVSDPTISKALSYANPDSYYLENNSNTMSSSGFSQFEQNVLSNYNKYTADGTQTINANNAAVLNSSLEGLSASDAASATAAINSALAAPYSDSTIQAFQGLDPTLANSLSAAESTMTLQGFSQFETNAVSNYNNTFDRPQTGNNVNAAVLNYATAGLSGSDLAAASTAINSTLAVPYTDGTVAEFQSEDPTLAQTLIAAEPNMTLRGFAQLEQNIGIDRDVSFASPGGQNNSDIITAATSGLNPADITVATNAYNSALTDTGAVGANNTSTDILQQWDPTLASTLSAAKSGMTPIGYSQFETDVMNYYDSDPGGTTSVNNSNLIASAEQNLRPANQSVAQNAYAAALSTGGSVIGYD
jgi:hypothetical protein